MTDAQDAFSRYVRWALVGSSVGCAVYVWHARGRGREGAASPLLRSVGAVGMLGSWKLARAAHDVMHARRLDDVSEQELSDGVFVTFDGACRARWPPGPRH